MKRERRRQRRARCLFRVCLCHCVAMAAGLRGCLSDTGGCRAPLMALRLSICHQSSANEGAASAGAHVISTICDSTHEALVRVNTLVLFFWGGGWKMSEEGVAACVRVHPSSSRVTAAQLDLVLMEEEGGRRGAVVNPKYQCVMCQSVMV